MKALAAAAWIACAACGGKLAETRYYQLALPDARQPASDTRQPARDARPPRGDVMLVLETLTAEAPYDDDRIAYRSTAVRVDYYHYHRWSSTPGVMVSNYLEQALEASGRFRAVVRELNAGAPVVLAGRVLAIEEIDRSSTDWLARIVLELTLSDARSGEALWTDQLEETEPLPLRTPEGLAAALSTAMSRIVAQTAPVIADLAERQARRNAPAVTRSTPEPHPVAF